MKDKEKEEENRMKISYKEQLNQARIKEQSNGNYFLFRRSLVHSELMSRNKAIFYQDLCNLGSTSSTALSVVENGKVHFLCTVEYVYDTGLRWDRDAQQKMLKELEKDGIVTILFKGAPPKRYIHINTEPVDTFLEQWRLNNSTDDCYLNNRKHCDSSNRISCDSSNEKSCYNEDTSYEVSKKKINKQKMKSSGGTPSDSFSCKEPHSSTNGTSTPSNPIEVFPHSHSNKGYAPADRERAVKLDKALRAKELLIVKRTDIDKWSKEFSKLAQLQPAAVIDQVLDWYILHVGKKYFPLKLNAKTFCDIETFTSLRARYLQESGEVENSKASAPVELPPEVKKILTELTQLTWPMGSVEQLPSILLQSYNNYKDFHSKLSVLHSSDKNKFATHLYHQLHDPEEYIYYWFVDYNEQVSNWSDWSGDLKPFTITHKRFKGQMCNIANEWSGDISDWTDLFKQIQGVKL